MLSWNLFHGRSVPPAGADLSAQFLAAIAGWDWDIALLQEVPPWWPESLADALGCEQATALTSRNSLLPLRRAVARSRPDLAKSNGGGANAILSKRPLAQREAVRLRLWPERRVAQLVRLQDGCCAVNFHGSATVARAKRELERLWSYALRFAGGAPFVLGGDLNLRQPDHPAEAVHAARRDVDHLFACGLRSLEPARALQRRVELSGGIVVELSDHPPLLVDLAPA